MLNPIATKPLSDVEASYIAGFLDGEGSFFMVLEPRKENRSGYRIAPHLDASQVRPAVLEWIQDRCGGRMRLEDKSNAKNNAQNCWRIAWQPNQQRWLIPQIKPYLIVKRELAELFEEFLKLTSGSANYGKFNGEHLWEIYQQVRQHNHRGRQPFKRKTMPKSWAEIRPHKPSRPITACTIDRCKKRKFAKGLCKKHHRHQHINKNEAAPKNCAHCGILMEEVRPDQVYCGLSCKSKAARARKKATSNQSENLNRTD